MSGQRIINGAVRAREAENAGASGRPDLKAEVTRRTRRSFLAGGAAAVGAYGLWRGLTRGSLAQENLKLPLRAGEEANAWLARQILGEGARAPGFAPEQAMRTVRVNGNIGLDPDVRVETWRMQLTGLRGIELQPEYVENVDAGRPRPSTQQEPVEAGAKAAAGEKDQSGAAQGDLFRGLSPAGLLLTLDRLRELPHRDLTYELKCIEGWSQIVHWGGVRVRDLVASLGIPPSRFSELPPFVSVATPDQRYYVGLRSEEMLHPQTLLCYAMHGEPLTPEHGSPLRLVTPTKYGIKHLKQIGRIAFMGTRPRDYWAEQGYDWSQGL